jgi:hypothetical protein
VGRKSRHTADREAESCDDGTILKKNANGHRQSCHEDSGDDNGESTAAFAVSVRSLRGLAVVQVDLPPHRYFQEAFFCKDDEPEGGSNWTAKGLARDCKTLTSDAILGHDEESGVTITASMLSEFVCKGEKMCMGTENMDLCGDNLCGFQSNATSKWMGSSWCAKCHAHKGPLGPSLWDSCGTWFRNPAKRIGSREMLLFANNINNKHWNFLQALPNDGQWRVFDGFEKTRKSGEKPDSDTASLVQKLSYLLEQAAEKYPNTDTIQYGYAKFSGASKWPVHTVYADKIPIQLDGWSCGHRVLILSDMLQLGYKVEDMKDVYVNSDMPKIRRALGHHVLGKTKDVDVRV